MLASAPASVVREVRDGAAPDGGVGMRPRERGHVLRSLRCDTTGLPNISVPQARAIRPLVGMCGDATDVLRRRRGGRPIDGPHDGG
jgi:hypothetical protein